MANDVHIISGSDPKHGTIVVGLPPTGPSVAPTHKIDTYVSNVPASGDLLGKYTDRFDDPRYYTGDDII